MSMPMPFVDLPKPRSDRHGKVAYLICGSQWHASSARLSRPPASNAKCSVHSSTAWTFTPGAPRRWGKLAKGAGFGVTSTLRDPQRDDPQCLRDSWKGRFRREANRLKCEGR